MMCFEMGGVGLERLCCIGTPETRTGSSSRSREVVFVGSMSWLSLLPAVRTIHGGRSGYRGVVFISTFRKAKLTIESVEVVVVVVVFRLKRVSRVGRGEMSGVVRQGIPSRSCRSRR